jgi:hypothetical protein
MPQLDSGPMRPKTRTTLACTLLAALAALAGCGGGGSDTIPDGQAQELQNTVENVRDTYANDNCEDMQTYLADLNDQVDGLDVSSDLKDGLRELTDRLGEQTSDCQQETTTSSSTSSTTTTPDTLDTTTTPPTDTTETDSSTTETTSTEPTTTTDTGPTVDPTTPPGNGPGGAGPPGQGGSGGTAPRKEDKAKHDKKAEKPTKDKGKDK